MICSKIINPTAEIYEANAFKSINMKKLSIIIMLAVILAYTGCAQAQTYEMSVLPQATYLHIDTIDYSKGALNTTPVDLSLLGISGGDWLLLSALGEFNRGRSFGDDWSIMTGVFSSSNVLLPYNNLNRVQNAISANGIYDYVTPVTYYNLGLTDIPEDFRIFHITDTDQTIMQVPPDAAYLFVAAGDDLYYDNSDPNNNFTLRMVVVPDPTSQECNLPFSTFYRDADADGYGDPIDSIQFCTQPSGFVSNSLDCDDTDPDVNPDAAEICDDKDNNCNGIVDSDNLTCSPDLMVMTVSNPPLKRKRGRSFSVRDTVANQSLIDAEQSTTRYYLSKNKVKNGNDKLLKGSRIVPLLNAGATSDGTLSIRLTISKTTRAGKYYLLACADDRKKIIESDETNNCKASRRMIRVIK